MVDAYQTKNSEGSSMEENEDYEEYEWVFWYGLIFLAVLFIAFYIEEWISISSLLLGVFCCWGLFLILFTINIISIFTFEDPIIVDNDTDEIMSLKIEALVVLPGVGQSTARKLIAANLDSVSKISRSRTIKLQNAGVKAVNAEKILSAARTIEFGPYGENSELYKCKICAVNIQWNRGYCTSCRSSNCNICREPIAATYDVCISCAPNRKPNYLSNSLATNNSRQLSNASSHAKYKLKSSHSISKEPTPKKKGKWIDTKCTKCGKLEPMKKTGIISRLTYTSVATAFAGPLGLMMLADWDTYDFKCAECRKKYPDDQGY